MRIHFKGTNYEISPEMTAFATKKLSALKKYVGGKDDVAHAYVDLGNTETHQSGNIWRAEINFDLNGKRFNAIVVSDSLEKSIEAAVGDMRRELEKDRKRRQSLVRRGGSVVKSLMRGFQPGR